MPHDLFYLHRTMAVLANRVNLAADRVATRGG